MDVVDKHVTVEDVNPKSVGGFELPKGRWKQQWIQVATQQDTVITRIERDKKTRTNHKMPFYQSTFDHN